MKLAVAATVVLGCVAAGVLLVVRVTAASGRERSSPDVVVEMRGRREAAADLALRSPSPSPTPAPLAFPDCYGARRADSDGPILRPATSGSIFANCQVVAYYGYPGLPGLGVLGLPDTVEMVQRLKAETSAHDAANGGRRAIPALEVIAAVAQRSPEEDGTYLSRIPLEQLEQQLDLARKHDLLVILDLQMGHSTVDAEVGRLLPYLGDSRVHLALDPEWAMPPGVVPGDEIGSLDAAALNRAQEMLSQWVREHRYPGNKVLVVHQFTDEMIRDREQVRSFPGVDLVIDMDGFGGREAKTAHYQRFVADFGSPHGGIKLFYELDLDLLLPGDVNALSPQPDLVVYQ